MQSPIAVHAGCAAVLAALLFLFPAAASTEPCKLSVVASIGLAATVDGRPLVPVKINGDAVNLILDLEDPFSYLTSEKSAQLKLAQADLPYASRPMLLGGEQTRDLVFNGKVLAVTASTIEVGSLVAKDVRLYSASGLQLPNGVAGGIGLDFLANYDIELDLANKRMNLFSPNHCPGQVVYWTHAPVGIVDMQPMPGGTWHYAFDLDGKNIGAFLTTDNTETLLAFPVAREDFNLTHTSKGVMLAPVDQGQRTLYRYPFKSLDANGLAIANPQVYLFGDEYSDKVCDSELHSRILDNTVYRCRGDAALKIGIHELGAFHLFFDFSEKKLYVTAAGAN